MSEQNDIKPKYMPGKYHSDASLNKNIFTQTRTSKVYWLQNLSERITAAKQKIFPRKCGTQKNNDEILNKIRTQLLIHTTDA